MLHRIAGQLRLRPVYYHRQTVARPVSGSCIFLDVFFFIFAGMPVIFSPVEAESDLLGDDLTMTKETMPHPGHDKHLCYLTNLGYQNSHPDDYKDLVRDPKFMCKNCGRVAHDAKNLCKPEQL